MLQYDRNDISEGIDINKTSELEECMFCHYWYSKDVGYKSQPYVCNSCYAMSMMDYESKNIAILNVKGVDYSCILWGVSKNDVVDSLNNFALEDKGVL